MDTMLKVGLALVAYDEMSRVIASATGQSVRRFGELQDKIKATSESLAKFGTASYFAGQQVVGVIEKPIKAFADLEESQLVLKSTMMNASGAVGQEYMKLNRLAQRLSETVPGTQKDMEDMFVALREQGVSVKSILDGVGKATANYAVVMKLPYAAAAEYAARFRQVLGATDKDMATVMDKMQRLKFASGMDPQELLESYKYLGPTLKSIDIQGAGKKLNELNGLIGVFRANGMDGSQIGTNLAMAFGRIAQVGKVAHRGQIFGAAKEILQLHHIALNFWDNAGKFKGIPAMIQELQKLKGLSEREKILLGQGLFGQEGGRMLLLLMKDGVTQYNIMLQRMQRQADMQQKVKTIMSGVNNEAVVLKTTITTTLAYFGAAAVKALHLKSALSWLNVMFGKLGEWTDAHKKLAGAIAAVIGVTGLLMIAVGALGIALSVLLRVVSLAINGLGALKYAIVAVRWAFTFLSGGVSFAMRLMSASILGTPVGWILLAVGLLATAAYLIYRNWGPIKVFFKELWGGVKSEFNSFIKWVAGVWTVFTKAGGNIIKSIWQGMKSMANKPIEMLKSVVQKMRNLLPFSPAKEGPFKDLHKIRLVETIAQAIKPAPLVSAMRGAVNGVAGNSFGARPAFAGAGVNLTYAPTIHLNGGSPSVKDDLMAVLKKHKDELVRMLDDVRAQRERKQF